MGFATLLAEESGLVQQELGLVVLLSIAALVAIISRRIRVPYTVALVAVGLFLSFFPNPFLIDVSSDLILAILVPPLLFEATLQIKWEKLRQDIVPILLLAVLGTLLGTVIVGEIITWVLDVPLLAAFAFGALISATDPVAVISFFRTLGVSKRLGLLVEGESLLNDGVAIVLFSMAVGFAASGIDPAQQGISILWQGLVEFFRVALGGLAVGFILGYVVSYGILKNLDDHLIETSTTVALALGAYVIAERFHVSGILAVVAAGLMVGNIGTQNTSPTTRLTLDNFWEFMAFVANSLVFLFIGLEIEIVQMWPNIIPIIVAVLAVLFSRAIVVYGITAIYSRFTSLPQKIPGSYRHVMFWGGLRGAISLALALTLTGDVFGETFARELQVMTFAVVLFTLLVQGITIEALIRRLGLAERPEHLLEHQRRQARLFTKRAGLQELNRLRKDGMLFRDIWDATSAVYNEEISESKLAIRDHMEAHPELEQELFLQARTDALRAERSAITDAMQHDVISEAVHEELVHAADNRMAALDLIRESRRPRSSTPETSPATEKDVEDNHE
ncbi:MAG: Na+/H+ antiporter [Chloroflexi bacterium]|jgi:CPA1 family monovalent cation:H+ antiporter|nr:Na+/H+ antiporter [Chloroflexota bacterium]